MTPLWRSCSSMIRKGFFSLPEFITLSLGENRNSFAGVTLPLLDRSDCIEPQRCSVLTWPRPGHTPSQVSQSFGNSKRGVSQTRPSVAA